MDTVTGIRLYIRVVETGSFTKAAQTLHMSKTTVTQLIQLLEARLSVKLLNRTTRKVALSAEGAIYYQHVVRLLAAMAEADASLGQAAALPQGRLRVDVPSPIAQLILVPALPDLPPRLLPSMVAAPSS